MSEDEERIMEQFLNDCTNEIFINDEQAEQKTRELLNTRISPINIREQVDNIILEIYALGKLNTEEIEDKLKEKYNLELIDGIDLGKIPFSELEKIAEDQVYMMAVGESSTKKPKREFEEVGLHDIEVEGRPPWENPQHQYKENPNKAYGAREPLGHTYSGKLLIIERSSP